MSLAGAHVSAVSLAGVHATTVSLAALQLSAVSPCAVHVSGVSGSVCHLRRPEATIVAAAEAAQAALCTRTPEAPTVAAPTKAALSR